MLYTQRPHCFLVMTPTYTYFLWLTIIAILCFKYITNIISFDPHWVYNVGTIIIPMWENKGREKF